MYRSAEMLFPSSPAWTSLEELNLEQIRACLERTHIILRDNPALRSQGGRTRIKYDAGPATATEFFQNEAKRNYNGEDGGTNSCWYTPGVFLRELKRFGAQTRKDCNERVVMKALQRTTERLSHYQFTRSMCTPYAGP